MARSEPKPEASVLKRRRPYQSCNYKAINAILPSSAAGTLDRLGGSRGVAGAWIFIVVTAIGVVLAICLAWYLWRRQKTVTEPNLTKLAQTLYNGQTELASQQENFSEKIETLVTRATWIELHIKRQKNDICKLNTDIDSLREKISTLELVFEQLKTDLARFEQRVQTLEHDFATSNNVINEERLDQAMSALREEQKIKMDELVKSLNRPTSQAKKDTNDSGVSISESTHGDIEHGVPARGGSIPPFSRGGRPRTSDAGSKSESSDSGHATQRKRMLPVARYVDGGWALFLDCDDEIENVEKMIQRNGGFEETIDRQEESGLFGPIKRFKSALTTVWRCGQEFHVDLIGGGCEVLMFRCVSEERAELVRNPRRGLCLVMAPKDWVRDEEQGGRAPIADQETWDPEFGAYFFDLDHGSSIAFYRADGERWTLGPRAVEISLEGRTIEDVEPRMGPLFVELPRIVANDSAASHIRSFVIGDAGEGRGLWRHSFPATGAHGLDQVIAECGCGWYFVRAYDQDGQLLDSLVFRYAPGLDDVRVEHTNDGHDGREWVRVSFAVGDGIDVQADTDGVASSPSSQYCQVFEWPKRSDWRCMRFWLTGPNGRRVRMCLDVDSIWWALREDADPPTDDDWTRHTYVLDTSVLMPTSDTCIWLRLPKHVLPRPEPFVIFGEGYTRRVKPNTDGVAKMVLNTLSDALDASDFGHIPLVVCVGGNEDSVTPLEIVVPISCARCDAHFESSDTLAEHVVSKHHDDWFELAELQDVRVFPHGLPRAVYICNHCQKLYPESNVPTENATTLMMRHIEKEHPGRSHAFTAVHDSDQIFAIYRQYQRSIWFCRTCTRARAGILPDESDPSANAKKSEHLLDWHADELWTTIAAKLRASLT